jgi:lysophospholipase L1-like esterase
MRGQERQEEMNMNSILHSRLFIAAFGMALAFAAMAQTYPNSMAVIGDSISQAALADDGIDPNQPEHSWSTGNASGDGVNSHYERILAANSGIAGNNFNNAVNGSKADDLMGQAITTVSQGVDYVTVFMGGNDVCGDNVTPTATYTAFFDDALDTLQAGLPDATILVLELPRITRIYDVGRTNFGCQLKWAVFQFCDNVLRNGSSQRNTAAARNIEYNNALRSLTASKGIHFDDDIFEFNFSRGDLSNVDCFHPANSLQALLAEFTYDAGRF